MIKNQKYEIQGSGAKETFCFQRSSKGSGVMDVFKRETSKSFSPSDRALISKHSDDKVYRITLFRYPVQSAIQSLMGLYTQGRLKKGMKELNYDTLFHLGMIVNQDYVLEKQATPMFYKRTKFLNEIQNKNPEVLNVNVKVNVTIGELVSNAKQFMGESKFTNYNSVTNNCQVFISSILSANKINNEATDRFVKQEIKQLLNSERSLKYIGKVATDAGAVLDRVMNGKGSTCGCDN